MITAYFTVIYLYCITILYIILYEAIDYIFLKIRHTLKNKDFHALNILKIWVFRNMTPLSLAICQQHFGGAVSLHFQVSLLA
jgi:hypothetical protein